MSSVGCGALKQATEIGMHAWGCMVVVRLDHAGEDLPGAVRYYVGIPDNSHQGTYAGTWTGPKRHLCLPGVQGAEYRRATGIEKTGRGKVSEQLMGVTPEEHCEKQAVGQSLFRPHRQENMSDKYLVITAAGQAASGSHTECAGEVAAWQDMNLGQLGVVMQNHPGATVKCLNLGDEQGLRKAPMQELDKAGVEQEYVMVEPAMPMGVEGAAKARASDERLLPPELAVDHIKKLMEAGRQPWLIIS